MGGRGRRGGERGQEAGALSGGSRAAPVLRRTEASAGGAGELERTERGRTGAAGTRTALGGGAGEREGRARPLRQLRSSSAGASPGRRGSRWAGGGCGAATLPFCAFASRSGARRAGTLRPLCPRPRDGGWVRGGGCGGARTAGGGGDTGVERSGRRDGPRGTGRGDQGAAPTSLRRQRPNAAASPSREPRRCLPGRVRAAAGVVVPVPVPVPVPHVFPVAPRGRAFPAAKPGAGAAARGRRRARIRRSLRHLPGGRAASGSSPPPAPARLPPQLRGAPPGEGLVRGLRSACSVPGGGGREAGSGAAQPPRGSPASLDPGKGGDRRDRAPRVAASAAWTRPNPRNTGPSWGSGHSVA